MPAQTPRRSKQEQQTDFRALSIFIIGSSSPRSRRLQHAPDDFLSQRRQPRPAIPFRPRRDRFQCRPSRPALAPEPCCALHSPHWCEPACSLAAGFLRAEHRGPRLPQLLLVLRSARFGGRNIGLRFLDRALGLAAPLLQHALQRLVHDRPCRARRAAPAESPSVPLRAVIRLVVAASIHVVRKSRPENEGYENC